MSIAHSYMYFIVQSFFLVSVNLLLDTPFVNSIPSCLFLEFFCRQHACKIPLFPHVRTLLSPHLRTNDSKIDTNIAYDLLCEIAHS